MEDDNKIKNESDKTEKLDVVDSSENNTEVSGFDVLQTGEDSENNEETENIEKSEESVEVVEAAEKELLVNNKQAADIVKDSSLDISDGEKAEEKNIEEKSEESVEVVEAAEKELLVNNKQAADVVKDSSLDISDSEKAEEKKVEEKSEESIGETEVSEQNIKEVTGEKVSEEQDLSKDKSESEIIDKQSDSSKDIGSKESYNEEHKEEKSSEGFFLFRQKYNKDFWKSFVFDVFFFCLCVCFTFVLIQKWFSTREVIIQGTSHVHASLESGEKTAIGNINVLVMGIDSVEGTHRSDTIFVLGVNPSKKKIMMLSIPRDTRVIIEDRGRKINEILPRYGESTLRKILEDLLKIKISRRVEIGFESFIAVVDAIGGVDINIEKPMHYDDNWGNLHIHFNPGMNHLNGQDALRYVRFRKDAMADLGRIKRQQDFVKAVIKKLFSPVTIVKVPSIIEKAFKYIKTDFTLQEILTLAKGFDTFDVKFSTMSLPGDARYVDKISFFIPYAEEAVAIGNNYFSDLAILEIEKDCDFGKVIPKQSKSNRKK